MTTSAKTMVSTSLMWVLRLTLLTCAVVGMRLVATGQVVHDHSAPAKLVQIVRQATQHFIDVNAAQAAVMGQHLAASVDRTTGQWEFTTLTVRSWVTA